MLYGVLLTSFPSVANILNLSSSVATILYLRSYAANILCLRSTVANTLYCRGSVAIILYCRGIAELSYENKVACTLLHCMCTRFISILYIYHSPWWMEFKRCICFLHFYFWIWTIQDVNWLEPFVIQVQNAFINCKPLPAIPRGYLDLKKICLFYQ